jgi:hypothetical protein
VFDEMPKRKKRGNITIIQMHGHPIQTGLKSNTILISPDSFDTFESNKRCCQEYLATARPAGSVAKGQEIKHALRD